MFSPIAKILVVDDMSTYRKLMKKSLSDLGYVNITEAADGDSAWKEIQAAIERKEPFELIISDWNMPKTKGIHLLNRVRQNKEMRNVPFIMLTAENEKHVVVECIQAGVSAYLVKPITALGLKEKLDAISQSLEKKAAS